MRIDRLELRAYGHFEDAVLDLSGGAQGLHVVYGPNEAGKSTALRALQGLLFGIHPRTDDNFKHSYPNLRIAGVLRHSDGSTLECVRRKGNKHTLRDADDVESIAEDRLRRLLGGVSDEVFERMFGIGHEGLRAGGEAIVAGKGDVGEILFVAGSGVAELHRVRETLNSRIGDQFSSSANAKKPHINAALIRLGDARATIRDEQLTSDEYNRRRSELEDAEAALVDVDARLQEVQAKKGRLERIHRAQADLSRLATRRSELEDLADVPLLPDGFTRERTQIDADLLQKRTQVDQLTRRIEAAESALDELDVPEHLLDDSDEIDDLIKRLGGVQKADRDASEKIEPQLNDCLRQAHKLLAEIRPDLELDDAGRLRLTRQDRVRIRTLASKHETLVDGERRARDELERLRRVIEAGEADLSDDSGDVDAGPLRLAVRRVQNAGKLDEVLAQAERRQTALLQQAEVDLDALGLWSGPLEELERLPAPSEETCRRFEREVSAAADRVTAIKAKIELFETKRREAEADVERLQNRRDVPTRESLETARAVRDSGWKLIRADWIEGSTDEAGVAAFLAETGGDNLADAFERASTRADAVADRLRDDAEDVALLESAHDKRREAAARLESLQSELEEADATHNGLREDWDAVWRPCDLAPLSPTEMREWLRRHAALVESAKAIRVGNEEISERRTEIQTHRSALRTCFDDLGRSADGAGDEDPLSQLLEHAIDAVEDLAAAAHERQQSKQRLHEAREGLQAAQRDADNACEALEEWSANWTDAMQTLGLRESAEAAEAEAFLNTLEELFQRLDEADGLRERLKGIESDSEDFAADVRSFCERVCPDLTELSTSEAASALNTRLGEARAARKRRRELEEERNRDESEREALAGEIDQAAARLDAMCEQAGCESHDELPRTEELSEKKRRMIDDVAQSEDNLARDAAGMTLEDFIADAATVDADACAGRIERLTAEEQELGRIQREAVARITTAQNDVAKMDGRAAAARAREDEQHLLAELEREVEQYAQTRLATALLDEVVERYRDRNQGPMLEKASRLFSKLTLGSFSELRTEFGDGASPVLVGIRPGVDQPVPVEGMSDGSRDQLYLALRLAALELYLEDREPLPFVVDDVLVHFDPDRAAAALEALSDLSKRTQVIFFTHHRHLLEHAAEKLPAEVLFTHELMIT